ncbi:DUF1294 domain-containing protein [Noviherbaspirillum galbum]|uniref:DUF1294 domain-containing protein n=1 Tax=Noviherbaspirillum galbum TaxID=2709383 RepID=A0A6B3SRK5_9BURK|nr:DUF1294 domain-containing protein [Noviherbaspirillum galbum]NEX63560.1 DUF1294 domain-containing protein [Noviherbaspirillum galbum]
MTPIAGVLAAWYASLSIVTFGAYARDKAAARRQARRTPERTLHLLALLGGWPGGLLGRHLLRHKTRKPGFHAVLWTSAVLHLLALAWLATIPGTSS